MLSEGLFLLLVHREKLWVHIALQRLTSAGQLLDLREIVLDNLVEFNQRNQTGFVKFLVNRSLALLQVFNEFHQEDLHQDPRDDEHLHVVEVLAVQKLL